MAAKAGSGGRGGGAGSALLLPAASVVGNEHLQRWLAGCGSDEAERIIAKHFRSLGPLAGLMDGFNKPKPQKKQATKVKAGSGSGSGSARKRPRSSPAGDRQAEAGVSANPKKQKGGMGAEKSTQTKRNQPGASAGACSGGAGSSSAPQIYTWKVPPADPSVPTPPYVGKIRRIGLNKVENGRLKILQAPIVEMTDSTNLYRENKAADLLRRLHEDGYVYIKGVLPPGTVDKSREVVLKLLRNVGWAEGEDNTCSKGSDSCTVDVSDGMIIAGDREQSSRLPPDLQKQWHDMCQEPDLAEVFEGSALQRVFDSLARGATETTGISHDVSNLSHFAWLRIKKHGGLTPEHADYFHLSNASDLFSPGSVGKDWPAECKDCGLKESPANASRFVMCDDCDMPLHLDCLEEKVDTRQPFWFCKNCRPRPGIFTCWTPLMDVSAELGGLVLCPKSHGLDVTAGRYRRMQLPASFLKSLRGCAWATAEFKKGDIVIFDTKLIHATGENLTQSFRLSADARWAVYPKRTNFGSTVSSRTILKQGAPEEADDHT